MMNDVLRMNVRMKMWKILNNYADYGERRGFNQKRVNVSLLYINYIYNMKIKTRLFNKILFKNV